MRWESEAEIDAMESEIKTQGEKPRQQMGGKRERRKTEFLSFRKGANMTKILGGHNGKRYLEVEVTTERHSFYLTT